MLLRSVTKHIKDQNWFAVFLDFFIVVAGILIAFQITNWNEARLDREREVVYLAQIVKDLNADYIEIDFVANAGRERMAAIELVMKRAGLQPPPKQFYLPHCTFQPCTGEVIFDKVEPFSAVQKYAASDAISHFPWFDATRSTYDALISTGDIHLIKNQDLIRDVQDYYANALEARSMGESDRKGVDEMTSTLHDLGLANLGEDVDALVAAAMASPKFAAQLTSNWALSAFEVRAMSYTRQLADDLIEKLELEAQ